MASVTAIRAPLERGVQGDGATYVARRRLLVAGVATRAAHAGRADPGDAPAPEMALRLRPTDARGGQAHVNAAA